MEIRRSRSSNPVHFICFSGLVGTLQGTLLAAKSGLPPVACDGDKVFLTKNDGTILAGCGSFSAATGGDRLILDLSVSDSEGHQIIGVQAKARSDTGEIISVASVVSNK